MCKNTPVVVLCEQTNPLSLERDAFDDPILLLVKRREFLSCQKHKSLLDKTGKAAFLPAPPTRRFPSDSYARRVFSFAFALLSWTLGNAWTPLRHAPPSLLFVRMLRTCQRRCIKPLQPVPHCQGEANKGPWESPQKIWSEWRHQYKMIVKTSKTETETLSGLRPDQIQVWIQISFLENVPESFWTTSV